MLMKIREVETDISSYIFLLFYLRGAPSFTCLPSLVPLYFPATAKGATSEWRDELAGVLKAGSEPDGKILNEMESQKAHAQQNAVPRGTPELPLSSFELRHVHPLLCWHILPSA